VRERRVGVEQLAEPFRVAERRGLEDVDLSAASLSAEVTSGGVP
jgi:hypothetical protein